MTAQSTLIRGIVLFGDVVGSRDAPRRATDRLANLARQLDARYTGRALAAWEFTQGDEIQGLLALEADPFEAVLEATLAPQAPRMRWVVALGEVEQGSGPATQRTGPAFLAARRAIGEARRRRDGLLVLTGDRRADPLLAWIAPVLAQLLDGLTDRQREVARLMLVEGSTQAEVADRLGVARATISVSYARAGLRSIERLLAVVRTIFREGAQVSQAAAMVEP